MRGAPRVWVAFTLLSATFFMLLVNFSIVSIALPSMERELGMSASQGQWIVSTYTIFVSRVFKEMLTGRCSDIFGRFHFFIAGLVSSLGFLRGRAPTGRPRSTQMRSRRGGGGCGAGLRGGPTGTCL